jgi:hypothetical protein
VKEMALIRQLLAWGFPHPERQFVIPGVGRVDLAYPLYRVAIEYDSDEWHDNPRARRRDRARANHLVAAGWFPFIATADDLRTGAVALRDAIAVHVPRRG